jgi:protein-tyrosine phosphatase
MDEIVEKLWIGDWEDTQFEDTLEHMGFSHILCVVPHHHAHPQMRKEYQKLKVMHWHYEERKEIEIEPPLNFIDQGLKEGQVLVHCGAGIDRSPTVVMMYLIRKKGMTLEDAVDLIKERRPIANPHPEEVRQWLRS